MLRRIFRTIARCIAPFAFLTICTAGSTQTPIALAPLTIQLDWKPTAQFAGILVAKEQGYYAAEGLDVTIVSGDNTPSIDTVLHHVNERATWIGLAEADLVLDANAKGEPIKAFAAMMQSSPFALLTLKDSAHTTIKSLKGKAIGVHDGNQKAVDVLLKFNGMTREDVTITTIPYDFTALLSGTVAAMQGYIIDEPIQLQAEHHPVNIIPMSANGYTCYAEVLFATSDVLKSRPDELVRFLRATGRGWEYAAAHSSETAQIIVAKYAPEDSLTEQKASLLAVVPLLRTEDRRFGMMRPATWAKSSEMFEIYKLVERKINAADTVDYSILKSLYPQ
jgi:ABC-type nitrate/sulfonate/bicarbonate transport system substrate-binding protein